MKQSCIVHPPNSPLIIIRAWQVELCDGDHCAAALLSFFESCHNLRLRLRQRALDANAEALAMLQAHEARDADLWQFHTTEDLEHGLCGLFKAKRICRSLRFLEAQGFVTTGAHPKPHNRLDRTPCFLFHPEVINRAWEERGEGVW